MHTTGSVNSNHERPAAQFLKCVNDVGPALGLAALADASVAEAPADAPAAASETGNQTMSDAMIFPRRKHVRAKWHDYNGGMYFVTICVKDKQHLFGHICNGVMHYTTVGNKTLHDLAEISSHWGGDVEIINSVVMPNHVHIVICVSTSAKTDAATHSVSGQPKGRPYGGRQSKLANIIGGFKAGVTRYAKHNAIPFAWQNGFHDHIIRNQRAFEGIMQYVDVSVARWSNDFFNLDNQQK